VARLAPVSSGKVIVNFDRSTLREAFTSGIDTGSTRGIIWISYTTLKDGVAMTSLSTTADARYFSDDKRP